MSRKNCELRNWLAAGLAALWMPLQAYSQTETPRSSQAAVSVSDETESDAATEQTVFSELAISVDSSTPRDSENNETVRERFSNGKIRIERQVALDQIGNYVNHGSYQEFNLSGEIICVGQYDMGRRQGNWMRNCSAKDSKMFEAYPYTELKAPFKSSVEFRNDKMNGSWVIEDDQGQVACQISLADGVRHGQYAIFHPAGEIYFQAEYQSGLLNGNLIVKDAQGKVTRQETCADGQKTTREVEQFSTGKAAGENQQIMSEIQHLTPRHELVEPDNWDTTTYAVYRDKGERIKHGPFSYYFENGQLKSKGSYLKGVLNGDFESWYSNGQRETIGSYAQGLQQGNWVWWHDNGMRKTVASYADGKLVGISMAWREDGTRILASEKSPTQNLSRDAKLPTSDGVLRRR